MNLRELLVERILFACDDEILIKEYGMTENDIELLTDLDLFELYEDLYCAKMD